MPRQPRFSKDDIVAAGLRIVRAGGIETVSARALGKELGTSSSPMFTMFKDMNEVMDAIRAAAEKALTARMEGVTDLQLTGITRPARLATYVSMSVNYPSTED